MRKRYQRAPFALCETPRRYPQRMVIRWKQHGARWLVSVADKGACGGVWLERGRWRGEVWPRGRRDPLGAYFNSRRHAQQQVQRYLQVHPHVADVGADPRGDRGRACSRPDWRLAAYLRQVGVPVISAARR